MADLHAEVVGVLAQSRSKIILIILLIIFLSSKVYTFTHQNSLILMILFSLRKYQHTYVEDTNKQFPVDNICFFAFRFLAVRKRFMQELKELKSKDQTPMTTHSIISLLMGMKFFRVKVIIHYDFCYIFANKNM